MNVLNLLRSVNLPDLVLAAGHLIVLCGLITGAPWAHRIAGVVEGWLLSELVAVVVAPLLVWIFVRRDPTPVYQRAIALPLIIVVLLGLSGFVRFLKIFWLYLLAKCLPLLVMRPTERAHNAGVVRSTVAVPVFLFLAVMFLNRPHEPLVGMFAGPEFDDESRYLATLMLFGGLHFGVVGAAMSVWARVTRDETWDRG